MKNAAHAENAVVPQIAAGYYHSVGVISDGTVWSWGRGDKGQMGNGETASRAVPRQAAGLSGVKAIASGVRGSVAVLHDGTVMTWGSNSDGQLGDGTLTDRTTPVTVTGLSRIKAVSGGVGYHTLALDEDGHVWAWGRNEDGDLGDGTTTQRTTPVQVSGLSNVKAIAAGGYFSLALKEDGTVWSWGINDAGELGDGTTQQRSLPQQVPGLSNIKAIAAGGNHSLAVDTGGHVWAWGENRYGAVGDGTGTNRKVPVQISGLPDVTAIAGGGYHSLAVDAAGHVWAWGYNSYGQLGDGTTTQRLSPVQVPGLSGMKEVAAGGFHSFAMKSDGMIWSWGLNSSGQLGDNTSTNRLLPVLSKAVMDATAPTVSSGTISASSLTSASVTLNWTKAEDNMSEQSVLQYLVYRSGSGNIQTVSDMERRGTAVGSYASDIGLLEITGLRPGTTYYFNIIVKDAAGYKSAYTMRQVVTKSLHTVSYNGNGSTGGNVPVDSHSYEEGASVTVMDNSGNLVKGGHSFTGWNTQADGNGMSYAANAGFIMGAADVRLYAMWDANCYTVRYGAGANGTISATVETVTYGRSPAAIPIVTPHSGYTFAGWSSDGGTTMLTSEQVAATTVTADMTYTAFYTQNPSPPLAPDAPVLQPAAAGNGKVTLTWNPVARATGYKVYQSVTSGTYGTETATVSGSVYTYDAAGLSNGTTYYFVVKAANSGGDSAASNEVSAVPVTVPAAPADISAIASIGQAIVAFSIPGDDGGSAITGYEVTSSPGDITATGAASPIAITGLMNGTTYTFTVKAINSAGSGAASAASNPVTPWWSSGSKSSSNSSTPEEPATPGTPETTDEGVDLLINGIEEAAGTVTITAVNDQTVMTVAVDSQQLENRIAAAGQGAVITIPAVNTEADHVVSEFNGQTIKFMEQKQAVLEIVTENATYTLPAGQINIDSIVNRLGNTMALQDIKVQIEIAVPTENLMKIAQNSEIGGEFTFVAPLVHFTVRATYGDSSVEVSKFNAFVERTIAIPDGTDPSKITTGVVIGADGTVHHVPTKIIVKDGKYYARISSLTNSTYSVVWRSIMFKDMAGHWAEDAVKDMGSRMVVSGVGNGMFNPDQDITRAEFAAIVVQALGLKLEGGAAPFSDMLPADWYSQAIQTAYEYKLISGFEDGTFRPAGKMTREQAMTILAKAMTLTGLKAKLPSQPADKLLRSFTDADETSNWAISSIADALQAGIVSGKTGTELAPKAYVTRAEVAVMVQKLLQKSDLI
ncbi:S-layer homology domain-containing protein [Paenibacillus thalictri]|uniref:RCC1 domain-containing protein n=1 Tax=Paenibacillus thalictri TaxID=2527873 RepID=UPI0013EF2C96|nr:S-layer homology domain-containing protein [Paenibacillus thalictri]